ncbi:MAG TPA: protease complex subunit PrcB family protein [Clostridia bacterium]|nr:protease complex subunit PrcB family protein [Clostridia bacterium]
MRKILFLVALISIIVLAAGCNGVEEDVELTEPTEFDYEIIEEEGLEEGAKEWYEENKDNYGYYTHVIGEKEKYLLVSAGEKRTGGYSLEIKGVNELNQMITFNIDLNEPSTDDMVTQALTYPNLLIKITANETFEVDAILNFDADQSSKKENGNMKYEKVEGTYVGQIDNNFIEVDLSNNPEFRERVNMEQDFLSLMVLEETKEEIEVLKSGNPIIFDCYQNDDNTWIIVNIKINEDI